MYKFDFVLVFFESFLKFKQLQFNLHETDLLLRYLSHHLTWHCSSISKYLHRFARNLQHLSANCFCYCSWASVAFWSSLVPLGPPWHSGLLSPKSNKQTNMILSEIYVKNYKSFRDLNTWTVQSQCSNVEATASTRADAPHTKLCIPSNIKGNCSGDLLFSSFIWTDKK